MQNIKIDPMWYIFIVGYIIFNFTLNYFIRKYKEERANLKNPNAGDKKPPQGGGDKKGAQGGDKKGGPPLKK